MHCRFSHEREHWFTFHYEIQYSADPGGSILLRLRLLMEVLPFCERGAFVPKVEQKVSLSSR